MEHVELIADRFLRTASGCIDLASGERVCLRRWRLRDPSTRHGWLERSASLWAIRHPHLVQVVDYGCLGAIAVFEVLRTPVSVGNRKMRDGGTAQAIRSAVEFLLGQGLSPGRLAWHRVVELEGRPMLLPDEGTGWPLDAQTAREQHRCKRQRARVEAEQVLLARFLRRSDAESDASVIVRQRAKLLSRAGPNASAQALRVVNQIVEWLESSRPAEVRRVRLVGQQSVCADVLAFAAREARLRGFVPVSTACAAGSAFRTTQVAFRDLIRVITHHHVLLIDWNDDRSGRTRPEAVRLLLELGATSARPHLMLTVSASSSTPEDVLHLTSSTGHGPPRTDESQTEDPGSAFTRAVRSAPRAIERVRESPSDYRASSTPGPSDQSRTGGAEEGNLTRRTLVECDTPVASSAGHTRARNRCLEGLRLAGRGRHAAGERLLRDAAAALARRGDDGWAGQATLSLGRLLQRRGRCREAAAAFEEARTYFDRSGHVTSSIRATVYLGLAWTDDGRLCQSEAVLRAAAMAAEESDSAQAHEFARLALVRCLIWQRRWDEALGLISRGRLSAESSGPALCGLPMPQVAAGSLDGATTDDGQCREAAVGWRWDEDVDAGVMAACLASRIAVGRQDLAAAGVLATKAGRLATQSTEPRDRVAAQAVAARVHAEIADVDGLRRLVRQGLQEAARAHAPLEAVRLRLLLIDGLRRGGLSREADRLATRLAGMCGNTLPLLLRGRVAAAARGLLSTETEAAVPGIPPRPRGLPAAPVPRAAPSQLSHDDKTVAADVMNLLVICNEVADDSALVDRLALYLRQQMRASSVAFFGSESSELVSVASAGARPLPAEIASRACDAGLAISPSDSGDNSEAAVPIRYGGAIVGALACRWPADMLPRPDRVEAILSTAGTLAAPAVRAVLDRRACPQVVLSVEPDLMGAGELMDRLRATIARAAATPFPVLIEGESGTGKELVARAIHRLSPRRDRKCHTLNCAALTDDLVEAELFGHARGAFTGAVGERAGLFEDADGGTIVLDEVGELSARAQAKLLRVLQEGEVRRVGENVMRSVDVRIVAAANRPLQDEVEAGRFRRDLFYRLAVIRIVVPPLRDRVDDIPVLASHFWVQATGRTGSRATLASATLAALARYDWPGNVRELQNIMTALAVSAPRRGAVGPTSLPAALSAPEGAVCRTTLGEARRAFEIRYVRASLARAGGRRGRAARELGLSRQGFAKVLARLNIDAAGG
jgi:transcriptional regulator with GAF, ATPase, and Fis domain